MGREPASGKPSGNVTDRWHARIIQDGQRRRIALPDGISQEKARELSLGGLRSNSERSADRRCFQYTAGWVERRSRATASCAARGASSRTSMCRRKPPTTTIGRSRPGSTNG